MRQYKLFVIPLLIFSITLFGQKSENQVSFAQESKAHSYYVEQVELWWKEIEKDKTNEMSWYNYFRANRNSQGTASWSKDFVNESSSMNEKGNCNWTIPNKF